MVVMKNTCYEFLKSFTNIISNNVYSEKDNTVNLLSSHIKNDKIFIIAADKESYTVILKKGGYITKVNSFFEEGRQQGKCIETIETKVSDLEHFEDFLYMHFKKTEIMIKCIQPGRFFATAETH